MKKTADCIIIGGGILGCAAGYELAKLGVKVLIIEKEYLASGSTGRCICGIRQQFSALGTIKLAMESVVMFQEMEREFGVSVDWYPGGYLLLAHSKAKEKDYFKVIELQKKLGLNVTYITIDEVLKIIPQLNPKGLLGAVYCPTDGQADPFRVIIGYATAIKMLGSEIMTYTEIRKIKVKNGKVISVITDKKDEYFAPVIINAAGPWVKEVGQLVGVKLPCEPEYHEALVTEATYKLFDPMIVDYRPRGCYFQQLHHTGQIIGCYTPEHPVKGISREASIEFLHEMPSRMLNLIPSLSELKVLRQWAGWYTMTPDGNPIVGETEVEGFWVIGGSSGHGFMLGPALGKCLAELIVNGTSSLPLDEFSLDRKFEKGEMLK